MKLRKSKKAIAPIVAELLIIVVVIAAGLVIYAWSSGFLSLQTGKAGITIEIKNVKFWTGDKDVSPARVSSTLFGNVTIYAQNTGTKDATLKSVTVAGGVKSFLQITSTSSPIYATGISTDDATLDGGWKKGALIALNVTIADTYDTKTGWKPSTDYAFKILTAEGAEAPSTTFTAPKV